MANEIHHIQSQQPQGEIILYQPDETVRLEVRLEDETVWLTQAQIVVLFQKAKSTISFHISNIFKEGELDEDVVVRKYRTTTQHGAIPGKNQTHEVTYYNLDVIISVGYRVRSMRGTKFRQWATGVIRDHLLRGYSLNRRMNLLEAKIEMQTRQNENSIQQINTKLDEHQQKLDFFVQTNLPPVVGVFCGGQVFSARLFVENLVKMAVRKESLLTAADGKNHWPKWTNLNLHKTTGGAGNCQELLDGSAGRRMQERNSLHILKCKRFLPRN